MTEIFVKRARGEERCLLIHGPLRILSSDEFAATIIATEGVSSYSRPFFVDEKPPDAFTCGYAYPEAGTSIDEVLRRVAQVVRVFPLLEPKLGLRAARHCLQQLRGRVDDAATQVARVSEDLSYAKSNLVDAMRYAERISVELAEIEDRTK